MSSLFNKKNKMMKKYFSILLLVAFLSFTHLKAEIVLPYFFGDNMVLQQKALTPVWGKAKPGSMVKVRTSWNNADYYARADRDGKWKTSILTPSAGGPYVLSLFEGGKTEKIISNVFIGEVWLLAGQSNMEIPLQGYRDQPIIGSAMEILKSGDHDIHWFKVHRSPSTVELDTVKNSSWEITAPDNAGELSATGWFFAKLLSEQLNVPIGLINCYYGGSTVEAWMRPELLADYKDYAIPGAGDVIPYPNRTPTTLFKGMINPIIGYGIRGCLWYQGESNYIWPERYKELFPAMVNDWRNLWGQGNFPFYYAQIAPYDYSILKEENYVNSAYMRDAQRVIEPMIPNSGMVVLLDEGDSLTIHPRDKATVGERFAMMALENAYGVKTVGMSSPKYKSMEIKGNEIELSFDDAPVGLSTFGKELTDFEVAGSDKVFHQAKARIERAKVIVTSPANVQPVAVRYGFKDFVRGNLKGANGMPVSSFRTDDWPVVSE
jgi:sialate O-acetylesterase